MSRLLEQHHRMHSDYTLLFKKALALSLCLFILLFVFSKRIVIKKKERPVQFIMVTQLENIPQTTHGGLQKPPTLPLIPIPVEDEYIPDDETIELTELDLTEEIAFAPGAGQVSGNVRVMPRVYSVPEIPDDIKKKALKGVVELHVLVNFQGRVDSVKVMRNTTGSSRLEKSAIAAAYKTRYHPFKKDQIPRWILLPFNFEIYQ